MQTKAADFWHFDTPDLNWEKSHSSSLCGKALLQVSSFGFQLLPSLLENHWEKLMFFTCSCGIILTYILEKWSWKSGTDQKNAVWESYLLHRKYVGRATSSRVALHYQSYLQLRGEFAMNCCCFAETQVLLFKRKEIITKRPLGAL